MRKTRFHSILALLLVLCMLFTSCNWFKGDEEAHEDCEHTNTVVENSKESTCLEKGYSGDEVCADCKKVITPGEELPLSTTHSYGEGEVTKAASCIEAGIISYTCTVCGEAKLQPIEQLPHSDEYHDLLDGNHQHVCGSCTMDENEEHTPTDSGKYFPATCLNPAYTEYTCALCNGVYIVYSDDDLALGSHELTSWSTENASCTSEGRRVRICNRQGCDHVDEIVIPISDVHFYKFSEYITVPSCSEDGLAEYKCDCGATTEKTVAKNGVHNYKAADTDANGFLVKECSDCGHTVSSYDASAQVSAVIKASAISKDKALEMAMKEAAIEFPTDVVSQIAAGSDVAISADVLDSSAKNDAMSKVEDEEQKAALENAPIYDFTVKVDNEIFSDNFAEPVLITVKYDRGENDAEGIVIYYLAENGEIEAITDVVYNELTGEVSFYVNHFSYYAVAYSETPEMSCRRGNHEFKETGEVVEATCYRF